MVLKFKTLVIIGKEILNALEVLWGGFWFFVLDISGHSIGAFLCDHSLSYTFVIYDLEFFSILKFNFKSISLVKTSNICSVFFLTIKC